MRYRTVGDKITLVLVYLSPIVGDSRAVRIIVDDALFLEGNGEMLDCLQGMCLCGHAVMRFYSMWLEDIRLQGIWF